MFPSIKAYRWPDMLESIRRSSFETTNLGMTRWSKLRLCAHVALVTLLVVSVLPQVSAGQEEESASVEQQVARLLDTLQSGNLGERDAAEEQIIALGKKAAEFLPEIDANTSGEMKIRLERITTKLGTPANPAATSIKASRATVSGKMTVSEALAELEEQTGNKVNVQGEALGMMIDLEHEDATFWEITSDIMSQASLCVQPYAIGDDELMLATHPNPPQDIQPAINGPFRIDVESIRVERTFGQQAGRQLEVNCSVSWEPRLKPTALVLPMQDVVAIVAGDEEEQLRPVNPGARPTITLTSGGATTTITMVFAGVSRERQKLKSLRGNLLFAIPGERQTFEFAKLNSGARQTQKNGNVRVTLASFTRNRRTYEARLLVVVEQVESIRRMLQSQEAYLRDAKDLRIESVADNEFPGVGGSAGLAYLFSIGGDPKDYRLVFEMPGGFSEASGSYELTDVPLP